MTLSEELTWRGFVNQTTYTDLAALNGEPITFYWGVDPSADSMQIGNLAAAMMVKCFIKHGHKPVLLVGGATGLIGDPDGKAQERDLKTADEIGRNVEALVKQYHQVFGSDDLTVVNNYDWFKNINYLDFLRDTGKHVPMRQMLARDFIQARLGEDGAGISYAEFSYVLIQAYDYLYLHENHGVTLQVAGSDQWGNSIAGVDLIRRKTGAETHVYTVPLIVNKTSGVKFGKSEEGAVWLDPQKTTPTQFYQFWINADDAGVEDYLKVFTELDQNTIQETISNHLNNPGDRYAQRVLAHHVTALVHGQEAAGKAEEVTDILTGKANFEVASERAFEELKKEMPNMKIESGIDLISCLVSTGLASSRSDARRLIESNAIYINNAPAKNLTLEEQDFINGRLLLRRGKAFKDSALVEIG